jgi:hypothetical protein
MGDLAGNANRDVEQVPRVGISMGVGEQRHQVTECANVKMRHSDAVGQLLRALELPRFR